MPGNTRWRTMVAVLACFALACFSSTAQPDPSEQLARERFERLQELLPPRIQKLSLAIQSLKRTEMFQVVSTQMGKPSRDIGSGLTILQWDLPEGVLTYSPNGGARPTFRLKSGRTIWLVRTRTPVGASIVTDHEMDTVPGLKHHGMMFYIGDLRLTSDGAYRFRDSRTNLGERGDQSKNFFIRHPTGRYSISYAEGIGPKTQLESLSERTVVASLVFYSSKRKDRAVYQVVCHPDKRSITLQAPANAPFRLEWGF